MEDVVCELRDVGEKCTIQLPSDADADNVWIIGLNVASGLTTALAETFYDSDVIVALFYVQQRTDGHWVTAHNDMPLVLNDETLQVPMLLSHGSVLIVGDHTFTYTIHENPNPAPTNDKPPSPRSQPPPKPKRHQRGSVMTEDVLSRSQKFQLSKGDTLTSLITSEINIDRPENPKLTIVYDKDKPETDIEKSTELFLSIRESVVNNDIELLDHIQTPEQMVNICVSYMLQFCLNNGLTLSSKNMDIIYQAMTAMCTHQPSCLFEFISGMKSKEVVTDQDMMPFLLVLNHTLLLCMDNADTSEVCVRIFTHLSQDPQNFPYLMQRNSASLVYACMSVYNDHLPIQIMACKFMENLSHEWNPAAGDRCPVREAGLDLIVRAMTAHNGDKPLLRPALQTVLNVLYAHERRTKSLTELSGRTFSNQEEAKTDLTSSVATLDFIETKALPVAMDMYHVHKNDKELHDLCVKIMEYYVDQDVQDEYDLVHQPGESNQADNASIYEELEQCHSQKSDKSSETVATSEAGSHSPSLVNEKDLNAMYARVNKPKSQDSIIEDNSIKQTELIENDIYETRETAYASDLESEDEQGPQLDYETRERLLSVEIKPPDLVSIALDDSNTEDTHQTPTNDNQKTDNLRKTESVSSDRKTIEQKPRKNSSEITKKFGKYLRKLKPWKKQKFTVPHDLDGSSQNSKTYLAFETCDSDFEILESTDIPSGQNTGNGVNRTVKQNCSSPTFSRKVPANHSFDGDHYETALPSNESETTQTVADECDTYEDITEFERVPRSSDNENSKVNEGDSIYDLAGPIYKQDTSGVTQSTQSFRPPLPDRRDSNSMIPPTHDDAYVSNDEFTPGTRKPHDAISIDRSSNGSLDSFIPNVSEWDKIDQTSEDEFINEAVGGFEVGKQSMETEQVSKSQLLDKVSLHSDSESTSMRSRSSSLDSRISEEETSEIGNDDAVENVHFEDDDDAINSVWSPQNSASDYSSLKRTKDKTKGKKFGWVTSLRQIYEKPQKKLSKVKSNMSRSRSCASLPGDQPVIENPLYADKLSHATSTTSLNETKKSRKFPWRRKRSVDVPVLPTAPSSDSLGSLAYTGAIPEESGEFKTSSKTHQSNTGNDMTSYMADQSDLGNRTPSKRNAKREAVDANPVEGKQKAGISPKKTTKKFPWHTKHRNKVG